MRFLGVLALPALFSIAAAAPTPTGSNTTIPFDYEVIIVGGGPAGLSAASALGRVRRHALLIDSGEYRNQYTRRIHDILGFDGVTPAYYKWRARQQIAEYKTVVLRNGTVEDVKPVKDTTTTLFKVHLSSGESFTTRKVILATGIRDVLPDTPGLKENWSKGIFWCPWCDGHEHVDQPFGVLGPLSKSGNTPLETLTQNRDTIIFANGTDTAEQRAIVEKKLPNFEIWHKIHNIKVDNRTIKSIQRLKDAGNENKDPSRATLPEYDLFRVNFDNGQSVERAAFITNFPSEQRSKLGEQIGVYIYGKDDDGYGGKLAAELNKGMITNVPGIYAVGDANSDNSTNIPHALWSGKRAVVSLHVTLETEDAAYQVAVYKARKGTRSAEPWDWCFGPTCGYDDAPTLPSKRAEEDAPLLEKRDPQTGCGSDGCNDGPPLKSLLTRDPQTGCGSDGCNDGPPLKTLLTRDPQTGCGSDGCADGPAAPILDLKRDEENAPLFQKREEEYVQELWKRVNGDMLDAGPFNTNFNGLPN